MEFEKCADEADVRKKAEYIEKEQDYIDRLREASGVLGDARSAFDLTWIRLVHPLK